MDDDLEKMQEKLKQAGQEHVLAFWDELETEEKENLRCQIENTDFLSVTKRYEDSKKEEKFDIDSISPIPYINSLQMANKEKEKYIKIGEEIVRRGEVAVISMAGGQRNKTGVPCS